VEVSPERSLIVVEGGMAGLEIMLFAEFFVAPRNHTLCLASGYSGQKIDEMRVDALSCVFCHHRVMRIEVTCAAE